jgi:hypothetical protein
MKTNITKKLSLQGLGAAGFLAERRGGRTMRALGFDRLPEPVFLIGAGGRIAAANRRAEELLEELPEAGSQGALGRQELKELFDRAARRDLEPTALRVEASEGPRYYEVRFERPCVDGMKTVTFSDVTVWKRALAEKEALLEAVRAEAEMPVTVCARCGSLKSRSGRWLLPDAGALAAIPRERLSHGLCPSCFVKELAQLGLDGGARVGRAASAGQP